MPTIPPSATRWSTIGRSSMVGQTLQREFPEQAEGKVSSGMSPPSQSNMPDYISVRKTSNISILTSARQTESQHDIYPYSRLYACLSSSLGTTIPLLDNTTAIHRVSPMLTHGLSEMFNSLASTLYVQVLRLVMAPARTVAVVAFTTTDIAKDAVTENGGTTGRVP